MGAATSSTAPGQIPPQEGSGPVAPMNITLEDLELPPRRENPVARAAAQGQPVPSMLPGGAGAGGADAGASTAVAGSLNRVTEELMPGGEALGQRAFREDGLVGTEPQQLQLLAHYAELCDDFRLYQRGTRAEGSARDVDGAQLILLSGAPGTGKTRHAVSFARALGLPLLLADPAAGGSHTWAAQLRREVRGRDCVVFFDEIDRHSNDEAFASELRQLLDGVCQPSGSKVFVIGTTNQLHRLPEDVKHRAEIVPFMRPEAVHLAEMWGRYAHHLREPDLEALAQASAHGCITGRDVRHCASYAERFTAINYLNNQHGLGYCHGAALANCPGPTLEHYLRCVRSRSRCVE